MGNQPWSQFQNGIRERSISDLIKEIYLHEVVIYLSIKLSLFCSLFKDQDKSERNCFFSGGEGCFFFFKKRGSAENALISNVMQRKPRHAKFMSQSFFSRVNEYPVTSEN